MRLAHIVPTTLLPFVYHHDAFLCLSSLIVKDEFYAEFHRQQISAGKLVILDNPVHEKQPLRLDDWSLAVELLKPPVVILPDVIDDWEETVFLARSCAVRASSLSPQSRLMAVPHGVEHRDFLACARQLAALDNPPIDWFGVSLERRLNDDREALQRRIRRIRILQTEPGVQDRPIHLLGISEQAFELRSPIFRDITSADTSKFAVFALNDKPQFPPAPITEPYPGRASLGGSLEYFSHDPGTGFNPSAFNDSLTAWSTYALENGVVTR